MAGSELYRMEGKVMMFLSHPANDLAVDVKVEHAAFVSCANSTGENEGILKETAKANAFFLS